MNQSYGQSSHNFIPFPGAPVLNDPEEDARRERQARMQQMQIMIERFYNHCVNAQSTPVMSGANLLLLIEEDLAQ